MAFATFARFAVPRNVQLSAWNRNLAANMKASRGLAGSPLLRAAAEQRPPSGFAEQAVPGGCLGPAGPTFGEVGNTTVSATSQLVASLLESLAELEASVGTNTSEMLDLSIQGIGRSFSKVPAHGGSCDL